MKRLKSLIALLILPLLSACGVDKDSFTLVCDTEKQIEVFLGEKYSKITEQEQLTFVFVNQGLNDFDCWRWSDEKIECYQFFETPNWEYHYLRFDRISGQFSANRQNGWYSERNRNTTVWKGQCKRVTKAKF